MTATLFRLVARDEAQGEASALVLESELVQARDAGAVGAQKEINVVLSVFQRIYVVFRRLIGLHFVVEVLLESFALTFIHIIIFNFLLMQNATNTIRTTVTQ